MSSTTEPLACHIQIDDPVEGGDTALGELNCPVTGMAAIYLISPRPIRLWIDGVRVLDEDLWWRRYERQIRALIMLALEAGRHKLRVLYGPRSVWPAAIDRDCPSRNGSECVKTCAAQGLTASNSTPTCSRMSKDPTAACAFFPLSA